MEYIALAMGLVQLGAAIAPLAEQVYTAMSKPGGPSDADWQSLRDLEDRLRAGLNTDHS